MKKLLGLILFIGAIALALNFNGQQSLNGLNTTVLFTAPATGYYFVNGQLSLPQPSLNGSTGYSKVAAVVSDSHSVVYTGVSGASGFQINQLSLTVGDTVRVSLTSSAAIDQVINAVQGQVYFGNRF